jgi:hypothetical protein
MAGKDFPDRGGTFAAEGTYAHAKAEYIMSRFIAGVPNPDDLADFDTSNEYYSPAMVEYVHQYTDLCCEKVVAARQADKLATCLVEQVLHFDSIVKDGFGTGDMVIIADNELTIIDLKYGQGVPVSAENNVQLQIYAVGAIEQFGFAYDFDKVRMVIVQPRNGGVSEQVKTVDELLEWAKWMHGRAEMALAGKGDFVAGEHCRFCKAAPRCKALAEYNLSLAKLEFKDVTLLTDEEVADVLGRIEGLKHYAEMIAQYALTEAVAGRHKWPGYKLVEGRSRRVYKDTDAIMKHLEEEGLAPAEFLKPPELKTITDLTKALGKKRFEELLGNFLDRPQGKPTLAPVTDKRPEFTPGEDDFVDLDAKE